MQQQAPGIAKIGAKYGLIQGVGSFIIFLAGALAHIPPSWVNTVINTVLLIVLMVLAHRQFKKTHEGAMTYPQGLGSGTVVATVAAVMSGVLAYVYIRFINTGYLAALLKVQQENLAQRGITGAQAQQAMAITSLLTTPVGIAVTTMIGGVIGGFIVALLVSIFTQKADPRAVV